MSTSTEVKPADNLKPVRNCNDECTQRDIMVRHKISDQAKFEKGITSFFGKNMEDITPMNFSAKDIYDMIFAPEVTCDYFVDVSEIAPENTEDNLNIDFVVTEIHNAIPAYFRMALFRGFFNSDLLYSPDSFDFYKANKFAPDGITILRQTIAFRITSTDQTVTYWDLSSTIPPTK